jgi:hypothetical protein
MPIMLAPAPQGHSLKTEKAQAFGLTPVALFVKLTNWVQTPGTNVTDVPLGAHSPQVPRSVNVPCPDTAPAHKTRAAITTTAAIVTGVVTGDKYEGTRFAPFLCTRKTKGAKVQTEMSQ